MLCFSFAVAPFANLLTLLFTLWTYLVFIPHRLNVPDVFRPPFEFGYCDLSGHPLNAGFICLLGLRDCSQVFELVGWLECWVLLLNVGVECLFVIWMVSWSLMVAVIGCLVDWLIEWLVVWVVGWLIGLVDWLVDWIGWLIGWLDWLIEWLVGWIDWIGWLKWMVLDGLMIGWCWMVLVIRWSDDWILMAVRCCNGFVWLWWPSVGISPVFLMARRICLALRPSVWFFAGWFWRNGSFCIDPPVVMASVLTSSSF